MYFLILIDSDRVKNVCEIYMIIYKPKSLFYQLAMISFLMTSFVEPGLNLRLALISGNLCLILWEYMEYKKITIDALIWGLLFIGYNLYNIFSQELRIYREKK